MLAVIEAALARGATYQAHHCFSYASRLFAWALEQGCYGLDRLPTDHLRPSKVIGPKRARDRILKDSELRSQKN